MLFKLDLCWKLIKRLNNSCIHSASIFTIFNLATKRANEDIDHNDEEDKDVDGSIIYHTPVIVFLPHVPPLFDEDYRGNDLEEHGSSEKCNKIPVIGNTLSQYISQLICIGGKESQVHHSFGKSFVVSHLLQMVGCILS